MSATPRPTRIVLVVACLAVLLAGATIARRLQLSRAASTHTDLAGFTERDVRVAIELERARGSGSHAWLRAHFTPVRPGFRLYAMELPRNGLSGIGRPTLLEIVTAEGLRAAGGLRADRVPGEIRSDVLGLRFPAYPPGPVTLSLPVTLAANGAARAELSVTYMTCGERTCMPPTIDRRVRVTLPPGPR
jgi:hypothetical protein